MIEFLCTTPSFPIELLGAQARSNTILHKVCEYGYLNIVKLLVQESEKAAAKVEEQKRLVESAAMQNGTGLQAMHHDPAVQPMIVNGPNGGSPSVVVDLIQHPDMLVTLRNNLGDTCLHVGAAEGHLLIVEFLVKSPVATK